jgi:hypothetical protein
MGCVGGVPWAKAGTASSASIVEVARKRVNMLMLLLDPWLGCEIEPAAEPSGVGRISPGNVGARSPPSD